MEELNKEDIMSLINLSLQIKDREWFKELSKKYKELENNTTSNDKCFCSEYYKEENDIEDNTYKLTFDWCKGQVGFLINSIIKASPNDLEELREGVPVDVVSNKNNLKEGEFVCVDYLNEEKNIYCRGYWEGYLKGTKPLEEYICSAEKEIDFLKSKNKLLDKLVNTLEKLLLNNCENDKKWWQFWKR